MRKFRGVTESIKEPGIPPRSSYSLTLRVPFGIGVEFCRKYGVEEVLRPLLEFDVSSTGEIHQTPTKEEAHAAKRKQQATAVLNGSQYSPQRLTRVEDTRPQHPSQRLTRV